MRDLIRPSMRFTEKCTPISQKLHEGDSNHWLLSTMSAFRRRNPQPLHLTAKARRYSGYPPASASCAYRCGPTGRPPWLCHPEDGDGPVSGALRSDDDNCDICPHAGCRPWGQSPIVTCPSSSSFRIAFSSVVRSSAPFWSSKPSLFLSSIALFRGAFKRPMYYVRAFTRGVRVSRSSAAVPAWCR